MDLAWDARSARFVFADSPSTGKLTTKDRRFQGTDTAPPSRVEERRGSLSQAASLRFPSPLIEPDVPISGILLSDWLHRKAHGGRPLQADVSRRHRGTDQPSPYGRAPSEAFGYFQVLPGSSPITDPRLRQKRARSQGPFLRRHYPASQVVRPCPTPARPAVLTTTLELRPPTGTGLPRLPGPPSQRAVPITPVDRSGCIRRLLPLSTRPSPTDRRVDIHKFTFEACSDFTHVTARWVARPPKAAFVTRLRSGRLPDRPAR